MVGTGTKQVPVCPSGIYRLLEEQTLNKSDNYYERESTEAEGIRDCKEIQTLCEDMSLNINLKKPKRKGDTREGEMACAEAQLEGVWRVWPI